MPEIKLKKRMAGPDGNFSPGFVMKIDADIGQQLVDQKAAEWVKPKRQKPIERAVKNPEEKAVNELKNVEIKHIGGGWYDVDGQKVKGKKAAEELARG